MPGLYLCCLQTIFSLRRTAVEEVRQVPTLPRLPSPPKDISHASLEGREMCSGATTSGGDGTGFEEGNDRKRKRRAFGKRLTLQMIQEQFDKPVPEAADVLGIGTTALKKRCRELGVNRWPFR